MFPKRCMSCGFGRIYSCMFLAMDVSGDGLRECYCCLVSLNQTHMKEMSKVRLTDTRMVVLVPKKQLLIHFSAWEEAYKMT